ncbi:MAG: AzlC family ABC transporter permease [Corynebacterium sp.]|nr:AzlC family ABC transporter permease [Corynebacterium sp.]
MPDQSKSSTQSDFGFVARACVSPLVGLIPLGLAFGLVVHAAGFGWWWTPVFSILVYAGSMEYLTVGFVSTGVGPISAALAAFVVNFRHIFYGLTAPLERVSNPVARAYAVYSLTDEAYATYSGSEAKDSSAWTGRRVLFLHIALQASWVIPGIIGALFGTALPDSVRGMDFALTALFAVLGYEAFRSIPSNAGKALGAALICGAIGSFFSLNFMLIIALCLYFILLVLAFRRSRNVSRETLEEPRND